MFSKPNETYKPIRCPGYFKNVESLCVQNSKPALRKPYFIIKLLVDQKLLIHSLWQVNTATKFSFYSIKCNFRL